ncbi:MAG: hypothetical protein FWH41_08320, partial [Treponema sp.]|nr:hypothetical protein [Treponema sp.]
LNFLAYIDSLAGYILFNHWSSLLCSWFSYNKRIRKDTGENAEWYNFLRRQKKFIILSIQRFIGFQLCRLLQ